MSRIRSIKPDITLDEELAGLGFAARYFFINLWCQCDKSGRCEDRPKKLQAQILPWDNVPVETLLDELSPKFLIRYIVDDHRYIQVRTWGKHQRPLPQERESVIPPPSEKDIKYNHSMIGVIPKVLWKGKGVLGRGRESLEGSTAPSPTDSEPAILVFPTHGHNKTWDLTQKTVDSFNADFPTMDILAQCRAARAWCESNPGKRKTATGMLRFLTAWLTRSQNFEGANGNQNKQGRIVGGACPTPGKYDHLK